MFSGGLDFKELKNEAQYLDKLYHFCILLARVNKPIICKVNGGVRNIAAYALNMISNPTGTVNAHMRFD